MNVIGGPGSVTGLFVRIAQCIFAASSLIFMIIASQSFLDAVMTWHICWAILRLSYDTFCLCRRIDHHSRDCLSVFAICDWVTMLLTLGAGCSSLAMATFLQRDANLCRYTETECSRYTASAVLALFAWFFSYNSALTILWARANA